MITWKLLMWALVAAAIYAFYAGSLGIAVVLAIVAAWFLWADIKATRQEAAEKAQAIDADSSEHDGISVKTGAPLFDGINRIILAGFVMFGVYLVLDFVQSHVK